MIKRMPVFFLTVLLVPVLVSPVRAEQPPEKKKQQKKTDKNVDPEKVDRLIEDLTAESHEQRDRAMESWLKKGKNILPLVREAYRQADDPEALWRLERMKRNLQSGQKQKPSPDSHSPGADRTQSSSVRMIIKMTPAGRERVKIYQNARGRVRVTVHRNDKKTVYEAGSMKSFKEKHPEIAREYGVGQGITPPGGSSQRELGRPDPIEPFDEKEELFRDLRERIQKKLDDMIEDPDGFFPPGPPGSDPGEFMPPFPGEGNEEASKPDGERTNPRSLREPSDILRDQVGLDKGEGYVINHLQEDSSLKTNLGLREGDLLLDIQDETVTTDRETTLEKLKELAKDPDIESPVLRVLRKGKRISLP